MKRKDWHLDFEFNDELFQKNWSKESYMTLLNVFRCVDNSDRPVLSMLPPGINPAGAAVVAAMHFLPGLSAPPAPHCRIALYPGLHFVREIKSLTLNSKALRDASDLIRVLRYAEDKTAYFGIEGPWKILFKRNENDEEVFYHWISRCQIVWGQYRQIKSDDLIPRDYYGREDPYSASIDFIDTENIDILSNQSHPYDLLIYCPYFHSKTVRGDVFDGFIQKVRNFEAHRKLIVARSPFDYWSQRLEEKLKTVGIAISSENDAILNTGTLKSGLDFFIVDQFIDVREACQLFHEFQILRKKDGVDVFLSEIKVILRRLLVSLVSTSKDDDLLDMATKLENLADSAGFQKEGSAWNVIKNIKLRISQGWVTTKIEKLREISLNKNIEVWVTKDLDRQIINDLKQKNSFDFGVRLADRWMVPGVRELNRKVVLSRIDRASDLDIVTYLKAGDMIVMSSWEAVLRNESIMSLWERSERWREHALRLGIVKKEVESADPVLDLADYLGSSVSDQMTSIKGLPSSQGFEESSNWWDDSDSASNSFTDLGRDQLLERTGERLFFCKELHFEGNVGMFVSVEDELQVIVLDEGDDEGDIEQLEVNNLIVGMTIILFKDSERNSMFDILMDQLERSDIYRNDAKIVKDWKEKLRSHVLSNDIKLRDIVGLLKIAGKTFEAMTVRSWVYGSTMSPLHKTDLTILVNALNLSTVDPSLVFKSVRILRKIARKLGRALNQVILNKDLNKIDENARKAFRDAGIDLEELSSLIEARKISNIMPKSVEVESRNIRKLFRVIVGNN